MIFADKLISLRKKNGWSQEELAGQMNVSRQSVSKWEGAQSVPEIEKILQLSNLFGVSIDYLLKDELENEEHINSDSEDISDVRSVSMEEAQKFMAAKAATALPMAFATFLCIISPVCLLVFGALSEKYPAKISENMAGGIGVIILLVLVAIAVGIFIYCGSKTEPFEYLEKEKIETKYGVDGLVKERKEQYKDKYTRNNIIGTILCVLSVVPLFCGVIVSEENDLLLVSMVGLLLIIVGVGVTFFIRGGVVWESFEKLLQEGEYSKKEKESKGALSAVSTAYWLLATAVYLGWSLPTNDWHFTWIVWVIAGVMYPAVAAICKAVRNDRKK